MVLPKNQKVFDNLNLQPTGDITIPEYEFAENMIDPPHSQPTGGGGGHDAGGEGGARTPDPYINMYVL